MPSIISEVEDSGTKLLIRQSIRAFFHISDTYESIYDIYGQIGEIFTSKRPLEAINAGPFSDEADVVQFFALIPQYLDFFRISADKYPSDLLGRISDPSVHCVVVHELLFSEYDAKLYANMMKIDKDDAEFLDLCRVLIMYRLSHEDDMYATKHFLELVFPVFFSVPTQLSLFSPVIPHIEEPGSEVDIIMFHYSLLGFDKFVSYFTSVFEEIDVSNLDMYCFRGAGVCLERFATKYFLTSNLEVVFFPKNVMDSVIQSAKRLLREFTETTLALTPLTGPYLDLLIQGFQALFDSVQDENLLDENCNENEIHKDLFAKEHDILYNLTELVLDAMEDM
ncbi:hypothetical protein PCE1_000470 [Barthelona sp. PCE]